MEWWYLYRIRAPEFNILRLLWFSAIGWLESWVSLLISHRYVFASVLGYLHRCSSVLMIMDATSMYNFENYNLGPGFVQHTSSQYPRTIKVVPQLSLQSQLHICKFVGLFGSSVICMYLLVGWAICVAVDQFLSPRVIFWCSKLRSTRWGLESYSSHPLGIQEQSGWVHRWVSSHSYIYGRLLVCLGHYFSVPMENGVEYQQNGEI